MASLMLQRPDALSTSPFADLLGFDPFRGLSGGFTRFAAYDVSRDERGYTIELPVAGFAPEQIDVTLEDHVLSVVGKTEHRSFTRTLSMPDDIDVEGIEAKVEHGLLTLTLPFHPKAQPKKIAVK
jgi:HSP20 family protein